MKQQPDYADKKILFTAFSVAEGSEELAGYRFLKRYGAQDITTLYWGGDEIAAKIPADVKKIEIKPHYVDEQLTAGYDMVFRHQTTRPDAIASPITSNAVEFFKFCPAPIIAVTGTKGKGTTSSLIAAILKEAGKTVHLLGNIGTQAISRLDQIQPDDIVVFEISSFQLWDLRESPHVAVVLLIDEDHLDVHSSMDEYVNAKGNIARYQQEDDLLIYHPENELSAKIARLSKGKKQKFMTPKAAHIKDGYVFYQKTAIMPLEEVGLVGRHNLENVCAAISAAWEYTQDVSAIEEAVRGFTGLEHRLEFVAKKAGVRFYNDSFSAAVPAAIAAVQAFEEPIIVVLGGYDRHVSFAKLAAAVKASHVKHAILIGQNRHQIATALEDAGFQDYELFEGQDMTAIVQRASDLAESGDVVVLSPGSPSFDMFENYKARGLLFKDAVHALKQGGRFETFYFESYDFNFDTGELTLKYRYDAQHRYEERMQFVLPEQGADREKLGSVIDALSFYLFMIAGTSYYKLFPTAEVSIEQGSLDAWQADFFSMLYSGGLSQFVYENKLDPGDIITFKPTQPVAEPRLSKLDQTGILLMQSGGKDSLLSAELLKQFEQPFTSWHMSSSGAHPAVIDMVGADVVNSKRTIDLAAINQSRQEGGLNGHVPFSAIFAGAGLLQAVLSGKNMLIASSESSADEANIVVDGYSVNHQFSKTFKVELSIQEYLHRYVSPDLQYGSLLRPLSELFVGELFVKFAWPKYYQHFSSCNVLNYRQGEETTALKWDGKCSKCANAFLLFAPFAKKEELLEIFAGKNLLKDAELTETYRQLLGISDIKPFECVGTFAEMQQAYAMAVECDEAYRNDDLPIMPSFAEYHELGNYQPFLNDLIDYQQL